MTNIAERITLVESSQKAERFWLLVHAQQGPQLVGVWYRPPAAGEVATIETFKTELNSLEGISMGTIVLGDLNVHNERWLQHSNSNSAEGTAMKAACDEVGLKQIVRAPTREEHLLDLVLTNIPGATATVLPAIADHKLVTAELTFKVPEQTTITRMVWEFAKADWDKMRDLLSSHSWENMEAMHANDAAIFLDTAIKEYANQCIPRRELRERKSTHPWLNEAVETLVKQKLQAVGTTDERKAAEKCSAGILANFLEYTRKCAHELCQLLPSSKAWWAKTRQLLDIKPKTSNIPALKSESGAWIIEPKAKAKLFAEKFSSKYTLIAREQNQYSEIVNTEHVQTIEPVPHEQQAAKVLRGLKEDSATGPDLLPTKILRECADVLAKPFRTLALLILQQGVWPEAWMMHWIVPLFKKGAVFLPGNYRGIHLTAQISKAMERFLGTMVVSFVSLPFNIGHNQFAYQQGRGARDALAYMVLTWIGGFQRGMKFALYCSDVSGAFDRVNTQRMIDKLRAKGMRADMINVFKAWLAERKAVVVCGGQHGDPIQLKNMIYQGTVWGPWLWNLFYEDARLALHVHNFLEVVFADDLNAFRAFPWNAPNCSLMEANKACQAELHAWGKANQVEFDPKKESIHVISHLCPQGDNFKILGINFDCRLTMRDAIEDLVGEMRWRIKAIMRARRFHSTTAMVHMYNAKVLSYGEYRTAAIYHACDTAISPLNRLQDSFLAELGISREDALLEYNLAPLESRRDIAMLGLIHRCTLGNGPLHFKDFFTPATTLRRNTRSGGRLHSKQLMDIRDRPFLEIERRSVLGLIWVYNRLPQDIINADDVRIFQRNLQLILKQQISSGYEDWSTTFSPRIPVYRHPMR